MTHIAIGYTSALISAFAWALGPVLFRKLGDNISPFGMNLARGIVGTAYLVLVLFMTGLTPVNTKDLMFLAASGILGIALGDTFFFMALVRLGARLAVLIETLCPVVTVLLAVILLGEKPSLPAWTGIILTISGVTWVIWERAPRQELKGNWSGGLKFGALSVICTSLGIIFTKIGVVRVPAVEATIIRLFTGTIGLALWGLAGFRIKEWLYPLREKVIFGKLCLAVFVGVVVGLLFSVVAIKYVDASIAVPLNSTSPIFVLPIAALVLREKITPRSVLGATIAVAGIILIFLYS